MYPLSYKPEVPEDRTLQNFCIILAILQSLLTILFSLVNIPVLLIIFKSLDFLAMIIAIFVIIVKLGSIGSWFYSFSFNKDSPIPWFVLQIISGAGTLLMGGLLALFLSQLLGEGKTWAQALIHPFSIELVAFVCAGILNSMYILSLMGSSKMVYYLPTHFPMTTPTIAPYGYSRVPYV